MLDRTIRDLRHAARLIARNPLFALTAALSLAVGIGATTTIFTIVNALLLRAPAGVVDPARLVDIGRIDRGALDNSSYLTYLDVRRRATSFTDIYAYRFDPQPMSLGGPGGAERVYGGVVSSNYFAVLGARPDVGRLFLPDQDAKGPAYEAVLSHRLWIDRFNRDPSVVGRTISLNGRAYVVVGVAREGFQGTTLLAPDV